MRRGLQITMIALGGILLLEGLLDLGLPAPRAVGMGLGACARDAALPMAILGASWVLAGGWILASARDPERHLDGVRFAAAYPLVLLLALGATVLRGGVPLRQVAVEIGLNALFLLLLGVFYPRRSA